VEEGGGGLLSAYGVRYGAPSVSERDALALGVGLGWSEGRAFRVGKSSLPKSAPSTAVMPAARSAVAMRTW